MTCLLFSQLVFSPGWESLRPSAGFKSRQPAAGWQVEAPAAAWESPSTCLPNEENKDLKAAGAGGTGCLILHVNISDDLTVHSSPKLCLLVPMHLMLSYFFPVDPGNLSHLNPDI